MATSIPLPEASADFENRRRYPRMEVALPAFVHVGDERYSVQIVDLSPGGAKVKIDVTLPVEAQITLSSGTLGRGAVVRWQTGAFMGLCFEIEMSEREMAAQVDRSKALGAWMKARA